MSNHTPAEQMPKQYVAKQYGVAKEYDTEAEMVADIISPKRRVAVLYHADLDGFGSAYSVWRALKDTCELLFIKVQYGQEPPLVELVKFGPEKVFIVDFSYNLETLLMLESAFGAVVVADHHKTAEKDLEAFNEQKTHPMSIAFFDLKMSGAVLTWEIFHTEADVPPILLYVQDRDLWKFELENSKEINAFIATLEEDFQVWDDFYMPEAYDSGKAILRFQAAQIERRLKDVVMTALPDPTGHWEPYYVPFVNASDNISELGEAMCFAYPDAPFSVSYCDRADGKRSYSLRSRNGFDVSVVAKAFGGGGHHKEGKGGAAGFTLDAPDII